jgi:protein-tyrosine-phosphatase
MRRALPLLLLTLGCQGTSAMPDPAPRPVKRILFVCVHNSNRSQMAEALTRLYGGDQVEAYSAGSAPSGQVNPRAVEFIGELGYDLTTHRSKSLAELPAVEFDAAISMGCGDSCQHIPARRHEDWPIPDPKDLPPDEYRQVRDLIARRVQGLLQELGVSCATLPAASAPRPSSPRG